MSTLTIIALLTPPPLYSKYGSFLMMRHRSQQCALVHSGLTLHLPKITTTTSTGTAGRPGTRGIFTSGIETESTRMIQSAPLKVTSTFSHSWISLPQGCCNALELGCSEDSSSCCAERVKLWQVLRGMWGLPSSAAKCSARLNLYLTEKVTGASNLATWN